MRRRGATIETKRHRRRGKTQRKVQSEKQDDVEKELPDEFLDWSKQRLEDIKAALAGLGDYAEGLSTDARKQADLALARMRAARDAFEAKIDAILPDATTKTVTEKAYADIAADSGRSPSRAAGLSRRGGGPHDHRQKGADQPRANAAPTQTAQSRFGAGRRRSDGARIVRGLRLQRGRESGAFPAPCTTIPRWPR